MRRSGGPAANIGGGRALPRWRCLALAWALALGVGACAGRGASPGTLTLRLSGTAQGMPPGDVTVTVPVYPGARASNATFHVPCWSTPMTPYVKTAQTAFRVAAADPTVQAWYGRAFAGTGLPTAGSSMAGSGDFSSVCLDYGGRPVYGPAGYQPEVDVAFEKLSPHATLVVYHATAVVPPPREPSAYVAPGAVARVDVTYRPWNWGARPPFQRTITDPATIAGLAAAVNALPPDGGGTCLPAADTMAGASLVFDLNEGGTQVVISRPGDCHLVQAAGGGTLWDVSDRLWKAAAALFPAAPQPQ